MTALIPYSAPRCPEYSGTGSTGRSNYSKCDNRVNTGPKWVESPLLKRIWA